MPRFSRTWLEWLPCRNIQRIAGNLFSLVQLWQALPRSCSWAHEKVPSEIQYAQNQVLKNEKSLRADALASRLASCDIKCFWKKVTKYNSGNVVSSNRIENETGSQNITNMWQNHYKKLSNSVNDTDDQVFSYIRNNLDTTDWCRGCCWWYGLCHQRTS